VEEDPLPEIIITIDLEKHCWCFKLGSHLIPIRNGLYTDRVSASMVASEVRTQANGKVRVKMQLNRRHT